MLKGFSDDIAGLDISDEIKAQIQAAADKRAEGLIGKNTELLTKNAKLTVNTNNDLASAEELAVLKARIAQDKLEEKGHYDEALKSKQEAWEKSLAEKDSKIELFEANDRKNMIDSAISAELKEIRINPLHQDAATGLFKGKTSLVDGKAMIGDQSLSDAIKEWSETDSGKASRLAPDNTGGNANGGTQKAGSGDNPTDIEKRAADINKRFGKV